MSKTKIKLLVLFIKKKKKWLSSYLVPFPGKTYFPRQGIAFPPFLYFLKYSFFRGGRSGGIQFYALIHFKEKCKTSEQFLLCVNITKLSHPPPAKASHNRPVESGPCCHLPFTDKFCLLHWIEQLCSLMNNSDDSEIQESNGLALIHGALPLVSLTSCGLWVAHLLSLSNKYPAFCNSEILRSKKVQICLTPRDLHVLFSLLIMPLS